MPRLPRAILLTATLALAASAGVTAPRHPGPTRAAAVPPPAPVPPSVEQLVRELGHSDFATRERASAALRDLGSAALPAVRRAADGTDPEARARARALLPGLQLQAALEPRRVTLPPEPMTLDEAVTEITRQTGCAVTAEPGDGPERYSFGMTDVPFWDAVGRLAARTGLALSPDPSARRVCLVRQGSRPPFVAVDGAFRVELTQIHEDRDVDFTTPGAGRRDHIVALKLSVMAEPRFLVLASRPARITAATDDRGGALAAPASGDVNCPRSPVGGEVWGTVFWAPAEGLLRRSPAGGTTLSVVAGSVPMRVVVDRRRVRIPYHAAVGKPVAVGNETVTLLRVDRGEGGGLSLNLQFPAEGEGMTTERWHQRLIVEDIWGNRLSPNGYGSGSGGGVRYISADFQAPAGWFNTYASQLVVEEWVVAEHRVRFAFKDVPLP